MLIRSNGPFQDGGNGEPLREETPPPISLSTSSGSRMNCLILTTPPSSAVTSVSGPPAHWAHVMNNRGENSMSGP